METKRRAQSGLEYLVTYGWAIFIVVLVLAILWYMGVFDSINLAGTANSASGFASFTYLDHYVNTTGAVILLANSVTRKITVNSVTVGVVDNTADTDCSAGLPLIVGANGEFIITCASIPQGALPLSGNRYDLAVTIQFTDMVSGNGHTDIGFIGGKIG
ncbi:MAG: hypothetical protein ABH863_03855 [Candidatus Micrarchaeota archaeon]